MKKKNCQIFTPQKYAINMLNYIGYSDNLFGKSVLENSCGEGNILIEIVRFYINDCKKRRMSSKKIKNGLEKDIEAYEIDEDKLKICKENLDKLCEKYNIKNVNWNINKEDVLKHEFNRKFDFVIGNPPYISYRNLDDTDRLYLKEKYLSCRIGKFDYCYAFIESAINSLNDNGKMAFLVPNSIFKNVFGNTLRDLLKPSITDIYDNYPEKVFKNAIVSPSIIIVDKSTTNDFVVYHDMSKTDLIRLNKASLHEKWVFTESKFQNSKSHKFSDYYIISNSIATLCNDVFVIKNWVDKNDKYIMADDYLIEKEIIKDAVSPSSLSKNKEYKIIYPYYYSEGDLMHYTKAEFNKKFPKAHKYLKSKKEMLSKRKIDRGINWFEFGRSQALNNMCKPKLLISIIMTKSIKVFNLKKETIPFSGIYIVSRGNKEYTLKKALDILKSDRFEEYCLNIGIKSSGNSKRITCNDVKNYPLDDEQDKNY